MIRFSPTALADLRRHAEEHFPEECCGVLLGRADGAGRSVALSLRCRNERRDQPERSYEIDPAELLAAVRLARRRGEEIVGFYHSHPGGPARPSATDLEEAHWPGCAYVITAVEAGRAGETRSFVLRGDEGQRRFREEPVDGGVPAAAGGDRLPAVPPRAGG